MANTVEGTQEFCCLLLQLAQNFARPLRLAAQRVDLTHGAQDIGNVAGQRPALFQHADGVQELSLVGIDAAERSVGFVECGVVRDESRDSPATASS